MPDADNQPVINGEAGPGASEGPRISVVISCYNYEAYVRGAIESVLEQTVPYAKVIVVDDGSTDGSLEVIRSFGDRITVVAHENTGMLGACLAGLAEVDSEYVHFLDADDRSCPTLVERVSSVLGSKPVKVQFQLEVVDADEAPVGSVYPTFAEGYSTAQMRTDNELLGFYQCPPTSGNVFRVEVLRDLDMARIGLRAALDGAGCLVMPYLGEVVTLSEPLARYGVHGASMSNSHAGASVAQCEKELAEFTKNWADARQLVGANVLPTNEQRSLYAVERRLLASALGGAVVLPELPTYLALLQRSGLPRSQKLVQGVWITSMLAPSKTLRARSIEMRRSGVGRPAFLRAVAAFVRR